MEVEVKSQSWEEGHDGEYEYYYVLYQLSRARLYSNSRLYSFPTSMSHAF
jgi:hypothetical protein